MSQKKFKNFLIPVLVYCLISTLAGCAFLGSRPQTPTVHIAEVRLKAVNPLEALFAFQLRVINPNDFSFIVKGANCDFSINGVHLATGVSDAATEVPASGSSILTVNVYASVLDVLKGARTISDKKISKYKAKGQISLDARHFLPMTIPFESEGEMNIKDMLSR